MLETKKQMFDYIIIGGGSAGCVLAARLSEDPEVQVALLEAGTVDNSVLIHCPAGLALMARVGGDNWKFETTPQPGLNGRKGYQPRGKVLGGSSSINAMIYVRGNRADYDHWAEQGNPGWSYQDVLPYFKRSEHNERFAGSSKGGGQGNEFHGNEFHGTGGPLNVKDLTSPNRFGPIFVAAGQQAGYRANDDFNGAEQEGVGRYQVTHKNGERYSAAKAYLKPAMGRPNLKVITEAHTTRILTEPAANGPKAVGVEYRQDGTLHQIQCGREVLLCAGALQSPQVLMLSGIGPAAQLQQHGIAVVADVAGVGENLHDHVDVVLCYNAPQVKDLFGVSPGGLWRALKGIFEWRKFRTGMLTTNFAEAGGFVKSAPAEPVPDLQYHFVIGKLVDHGRKPTFGMGYSCHVCLLQPKARGSVRLASSDPLAAPLIDPNFLGDPDDMKRLVRGFKQMRSTMAQPALAGYGGTETDRSVNAHTDTQIEDFIRNNADTIYHPVGSCRMGNGPLDVVDAQLRVRGVQGLRVVDASVMPRVVSGNTNAPVIMMAEKASDLIKAAAT